MATGSARTPFDEGVNAVQTATETAADIPNPFAEGSVEFRNFELGRTFALARRKGDEPFPQQRQTPA